ncbi:patatin-like phospholipase family protein [Zoogloea sp.]|jgi:NTE family protein|uniref:patatin-like phospholipase family protein n=1 Tax=Zoogloea sp. TaxID=49181 RepID=UPI001B6D4CF5|nr:patatin-like phospholipase family protein [Zoogloea sp.]MBK6652669.1 patatin-like phospholipase family protein [Zoogloea sp.]MBP7446103.1 patatin-like phospholipase family protein [Zoogloea sp.]
MKNESGFSRRRALVFGGLAAMAMPLGAAPAERPAARKPRLAVVLGGGSARGFAHIGVVKGLEAHGIRPDLVVGCSAGSLVGAFWAAGFSGDRMEELALRVRDSEIIDVVQGNAPRGMVTGQSLQNFVNQALRGRGIESFPTPFAAVATRYPAGDLAVLRSGDPGFAVRASCSIPGVFVPAAQGGQEYLDGGLISPVPVRTARQLGADVVVAVDVGGADPGGDSQGGLFEVLQRSFEIMSQSLRTNEVATADIAIRPDVGRISSTDFASRKVFIAAGFLAAQRLGPVILERLAAAPRRRG